VSAADELEVADRPTSCWWADPTLHLEAYVTVWHGTATRTPSGVHRPGGWTVVGLVQDRFAQEDVRC
jgi:hypothetical protein